MESEGPIDLGYLPQEIETCPQSATTWAFELEHYIQRNRNRRRLGHRVFGATRGSDACIARHSGLGSHARADRRLGTRSIIPRRPQLCTYFTCTTSAVLELACTFPAIFGVFACGSQEIGQNEQAHHEITTSQAGLTDSLDILQLYNSACGLQPPCLLLRVCMNHELSRLH